MTLETKRCPRCGMTKPTDAFYCSRGGKVYTYCKECERGRALGVHHASDLDAAYLRWVEKAYGVTAEAYVAMYEAQAGVCAICKEPERRVGKFGKVMRPCVDHDHTTGEVRGLLCHDCNVGLAKFRDDATRLRAAVAYLEGTQHGLRSPSSRTRARVENR